MSVRAFRSPLPDWLGNRPESGPRPGPYSGTGKASAGRMRVVRSADDREHSSRMTIVARYLRNLWRSLTRRSVADENVNVVLDRRQVERRQRVQDVDQERRGAERRQPLTFDFSEVRGFLGEGIGLKGDLSFSGAVRVDGHLEGEFVRGEILIIGEPGLVNAGINVSLLQVSGQVQGTVTARQRVELLRPSRVTGTIRTPCLVIWKGALFNGKIEMAGPQEDGGGPEGKEEGPTASRAGQGPEGEAI